MKFLEPDMLGVWEILGFVTENAAPRCERAVSKRRGAGATTSKSLLLASLPNRKLGKRGNLKIMKMRRLALEDSEHAL